MRNWKSLPGVWFMRQYLGNQLWDGTHLDAMIIKTSILLDHCVGELIAVESIVRSKKFVVESNTLI